ncbi:MAG: hypothetical protein PHU77_00165 [Simplicispira sp.]|nr:hypothetical protein [Simplicispira sp.]
MTGFQPKNKRASKAEGVQAPQLGFPGKGPQSAGQAQALNQAPDSIPGMFKPGEFVLPPDTVHALGGKEALNQMVDATHTPAPAAAVAPRGFTPEAFFANGGAPEDEIKKNSFGDAAAASLDSRVNQIPTGGLKAPAPDGRSDTELGRNVNNALNAMGGMGVVSSVPLRQPPASTALATVAPAAGFTPGAIAKTGELATAAAPQVAQAARGLPGAIAGLQEGAQANAYAAAGRAFGGASAGATALDNNRPTDPMAQPKVNSFGDASAVARGASAALPSAGALSMGTAPQAAPQASPQVTTPEARKAVGLFPYSHPDAGKNIYAGVGFGKGGEQQAAAPASAPVAQGAVPAAQGFSPRAPGASELYMQDRTKELRDQIGAGNYAQAAGTAARTAVQGLGMYGIEMADKIATPVLNASAGFSRGLFGSDAQAAPVPAQAPAAASQPPTKPAGAQVAPGTQAAPAAPTQSRPAEPNAVMPGVYQHGRGQYSDSAAGMGMPAGFTGRPNAQNMAAAESLAAGFTPRSAGAAAPAQPGLGFHPGMTAPQVKHSGNDWQARKDLENAKAAASSIYGNSQWAPKGYTQSRQAAYDAAITHDYAMKMGEPVQQAGAMRENAGLQREGMQQQGSTARTQMQEAGQNSRFGQTQGLAQQKFGMEREALGFKTREAQQQEQLRNQIMQEQDPAKRQSVVQRMRDLNGTQQADPYLVVPGGQQVDENGKAYNMPSSVFNRQSGQFVQQPARNSQAVPQAGAVQGGYRFKGGDPSKPASWEKV